MHNLILCLFLLSLSVFIQHVEMAIWFLICGVRLRRHGEDSPYSSAA